MHSNSKNISIWLHNDDPLKTGSTWYGLLNGSCWILVMTISVTAHGMVKQLGFHAACQIGHLVQWQSPLREWVRFPVGPVVAHVMKRAWLSDRKMLFFNPELTALRNTTDHSSKCTKNIFRSAEDNSPATIQDRSKWTQKLTSNAEILIHFPV
jgi:hypothetical protein